MADRKHDKDELITLDELCEMAKMTKPTYQGLRRQGKTPVAYRMGRRLYFKRGDAEAWLVNVRMVRIDPPRPRSGASSATGGPARNASDAKGGTNGGTSELRAVFGAPNCPTIRLFPACFRCGAGRARTDDDQIMSPGL